MRGVPFKTETERREAWKKTVKKFWSSPKGRAAYRRHYEKHREEILRKRKKKNATTAERARKAAYDREYVLRAGVRERIRKRTNAYIKLPHVKKKLLEKNRRPDIKAKNRARYREYASNPEVKLAGYRKHLRLKFGIPNELVDALLSKSGECEICGDPPLGKRRHHVDHCHRSEKIRGILCAHCNRMLSGARDNVELLKKAVRYLRKYSS